MEREFQKKGEQKATGNRAAKERKEYQGRRKMRYGMEMDSKQGGRCII